MNYGTAGRNIVPIYFFSHPHTERVELTEAQ
jgi:hypothetical protein